ncbi:alpha/beta hydrolase, partial [Clostridioides difficile]
TVPLVIFDLLSCVTGYHPVLIKLGDKRGKIAIMAVSDYNGYFHK